MFSPPDPRYGQLYANWLQIMRPQYEALATNYNNTPHPLGTTIDTAAIRAEIASYDDGIAMLKTMINLRGNLISPFRIYPLPSEALDRIFELCRLQSSSSLTAMTHVCSLWRQIALKNAALWSHIELGADMMGLKQAITWIRRSHPFPLDVVINPQVEPQSWTFRQSLSSWLHDHASRVESLSIINHPTALDHLPSFPRLKYYTFLDSERTLAWKHMTHLTDHCPDFTALSIAAPSIQLSPMWRGLNITQLCLGNFERGVPVLEWTARKILSACPNLRYLECLQLSELFADYFHFLQEEDQNISPPITLSSLTELSVGEGTGFRILDSLDAPQLHKLRLFGRNKVDLHASEVIIVTEHETFWQSLKHFHARCHPHLTILAFDHVSEYLSPVFGQSLEKICGLTVKELAFEETFMDIGFLCTADSTEGIGLPFPYLDRLSFTSCRYLETKTLSRIITQRRTPVSQSIIHLRVEDCPQVYGADLSAMQQLIRHDKRLSTSRTKREVTL